MIDQSRALMLQLSKANYITVSVNFMMHKDKSWREILRVNEACRVR